VQPNELNVMVQTSYLLLYPEMCNSKYIDLSSNRNKLGRNWFAPVPSYIRDTLVKGEPHHNIFSGRQQALNQDYFKTLWSRFKRQSDTLYL